VGENVGSNGNHLNIKYVRASVKGLFCEGEKLNFGFKILKSK